MSRSTANHQTVISCDAPSCPERSRFITYSIARIARRQAHDLGWQRLPAWTVTAEDSPRRIYDLCPLDVPTALERKARRPEILAEERAARKAARALEKLEKRDRRARRKSEKAAEEERRKAERAAVRAQRVAAPPPQTTKMANSLRPILTVIERVLRAQDRPMTVAEIVDHAIGDLALPTASKTPRTIVSRDLAIDIKNHGDASSFVRVAPGTFTLRERLR